MSFFKMLAKRNICAPPGPRGDYMWSRELLKGLPTDPADWFGYESDFQTLPTGEWTVTQATTGTFALGDAHGGVALADCDSSTVTQGANIQLGGTAGEWVMPAAGRIVVFSTRVKLVDVGSSGPEFFVGVHETDTTIIGTSALSGSNYVGFSSVTDNCVLLACAAKAGAATTKTGTTMVEDTYALLEFKITGVSTIEFFVNGTRLGSSDIATANIPIVEMRPSIVVQSDGAVDTIAHFDALGCYVYDPTRA